MGRKLPGPKPPKKKQGIQTNPTKTMAGILVGKKKRAKWPACPGKTVNQILQVLCHAIFLLRIWFWPQISGYLNQNGGSDLWYSWWLLNGVYLEATILGYQVAPLHPEKTRGSQENLDGKECCVHVPNHLNREPMELKGCIWDVHGI